MTINTPQPGRELDALVAEKVMGWQPDNIYGARGQLAGQWIYTPEGRISDIPHYSSDIAAAWQVVEKMRSNGYFYEVTENIEDPSIYCAMFVDRSTSYYDTYESGWSNEQWAAASTAPHAICLAALKAIGALAD